MSPHDSEIRRWVEKAGHDRRVAELSLAQSPPITDVAAFHTQQTVEKLLKAYLTHKSDPFEKIHDLEQLVVQCSRHDPDFGRLTEQVAPLSAYAVRFRYPGPTDPSAEQVREALVIVNEVWGFVSKRLPSDLVP
jgi:HEPN domain-containing protein